MFSLLPDTYSTNQVLTNFGRSVVEFAAQADDDDEVILCYNRDALLELGVMLLHVLKTKEDKSS